MLRILGRGGLRRMLLLDGGGGFEGDVVGVGVGIERGVRILLML